MNLKLGESKPAFQQHPYIRLWEEKVMNCRTEWYIESQIKAAKMDDAPHDAIFKTGSPGQETWHTLNTCRNPNAFKRMGLPVPARLRYELQVSVHTFFSNSLDREAVEEKIRNLLMSMDQKEPKDFFVMTKDHAS